MSQSQDEQSSEKKDVKEAGLPQQKLPKPAKPRKQEKRQKGRKG